MTIQEIMVLAKESGKPFSRPGLGHDFKLKVMNNGEIVWDSGGAISNHIVCSPEDLLAEDWTFDKEVCPVCSGCGINYKKAPLKEEE
jgi:hypothetical protein